MSQAKLNLQYPVYPDLTLLPNDRRVYACWYYYTLAQKHAEKLGDGSTESQFGILEGNLWQTENFEQIARSVALMYGLSTPDEFMKEAIWEAVETQAMMLGLPQPDWRIKRAPRLVIPS